MRSNGEAWEKQTLQTLEDVFGLVREIPTGQVDSYN